METSVCGHLIFTNTTLASGSRLKAMRPRGQLLPIAAGTRDVAAFAVAEEVRAVGGTEASVPVARVAMATAALLLR